VPNNSPGVPRRDGQQALRFKDLQQRTAELQRLAVGVKAAHSALMDSRGTRWERTLLTQRWLGRVGRWSALGREFDQSVRAFEGAYGITQRRARARRAAAARRKHGGSN